jgi:hypothetical protein
MERVDIAGKDCFGKAIKHKNALPDYRRAFFFL